MEMMQKEGASLLRIRCLQFISGSVSDPVSFQLGSSEIGAEAETYLLQLGWTTNNDVVLRVTPKDLFFSLKAFKL